MKRSAFIARSPREIGDVVSVSYWDRGIFIGWGRVLDVIAVHSAARGTVEFEYLVEPVEEGYKPRFKVPISAIKERLLPDGGTVPVKDEKSRGYSDYVKEKENG